MSQAITYALIVLGYMDLPEEDVPPEEMWNNFEMLDDWFAAVKQRRENPGMNPIEDWDDVPMLKNEDPFVKTAKEEVAT